jgi:drug/metabolite transporter (DMT)-like permease
MNSSPGKNQFYTGIALAIAATLIWSGNFIVARGVNGKILPVSLAYYRWLTAALVMAPFAFTAFKKEITAIAKSWKYLLLISLTGIAFFNTFIYIAGRYVPAINLALIATTSSPVMSAILAAIFLKEKMSWLSITGLLICICGIVLLLSKGSWDTLMNFRFSKGDWWTLLAALMFAVYNIMAKRKPAGISPPAFLFTIFALGTLMLLPAFAWQATHAPAPAWNSNLVWVILYLGIGASVIAYLCWNAAIKRLGAARTALFGNLIPIFSTLEAVMILKEDIRPIHIASGLLVISGLIIANLRKKNTAPQ